MKVYVMRPYKDKEGRKEYEKQFILVHAKDEKEAKTKAFYQTLYENELEYDQHPDCFDVDQIDEEKILSGKNSENAYLVRVCKDNIVRRVVMEYGKSSAEVSRKIKQAEPDHDFLITRLPKIHDIIL